jgi:hypothetical protein
MGEVLPGKALPDTRQLHALEQVVVVVTGWTVEGRDTVPIQEVLRGRYAPFGAPCKDVAYDFGLAWLQALGIPTFRLLQQMRMANDMFGIL